MTIRAHRVRLAPIIHKGLCPSLDDNINGPSLVRRPDWVPGPGRYLLYFGHHTGRHIRLAFADTRDGPWTVHAPGVLPLSDTPLAQSTPNVPQPDWALQQGVDGLYPHLASPDVWIDELARCFRMLLHGLADHGEQVSYAAWSTDGLAWSVEGEPINATYLRRFVLDGRFYAMGHGGELLRLTDGGADHGPRLIPRPIRHVGVWPSGKTLHVFYTCIGDAPERILHQRIDIRGPWPDWSVIGAETEILRPELPWEGADLPVEPSVIGATGFSNALRDPVLFADEGAVWMIYAGGGEAALGLARIEGLD